MNFSYLRKIIILPFLLISACSLFDKESDGNAVDKNKTVVQDNREEAVVEVLQDIPSSTETSVLDQNAGKPNITVLNTKGLDVIYSRIFKLNDRESFFTDAQKYSLGGFNLDPKTGRFHRTLALTAPTQEYIEVIRSVLAVECNALVDKEKAALFDNKVAEDQNHFIMKRFDFPTDADISASMSKLLGYEPAEDLHIGAADYAAAFQRAMESLEVSEITFESRNAEIRIMTDHYKLLCIALGQDPRVYLR